jgi:hypothetical protein
MSKAKIEFYKWKSENVISMKIYRYILELEEKEHKSEELQEQNKEMLKALIKRYRHDKTYCYKCIHNTMCAGCGLTQLKELIEKTTEKSIDEVLKDEI